MNYNFSVRWICHILALGVEKAIDKCDLFTNGLSGISSITNYVNNHARVRADLSKVQQKEFSRYKTLTLAKDCPTRCHSKLYVLEEYIVLNPYLCHVLDESAPELLNVGDEEFIADCS